MVTEGQPVAESATREALKALGPRIKSLLQEDFDELIELVQRLRRTDDPAEYESVLRGIEETLAQRTVPVRHFPQTDPRKTPWEERWTRRVARRIRKLRLKAGLNQTDLARAAGMDRGHLSRLERAVNSANPRTLTKLAQALGVELGALDPDTEHPPTGNKIRELRERAGMKRVDLARAAGLPPGHISHLENITHRATPRTLAKLAQALGVAVGELSTPVETKLTEGKVRELRKQAGMSQADLARAAGLSQSCVGALEHGGRSPTYQTRMKLARALRVEVAELGPYVDPRDESPPLGKKIRELRKQAGMSQTDLARAAGLAQTHLSYLEGVARQPTYRTLMKLARGLGVDVRELSPYDD